ncbi:MAG: UDP-N-acetylmuramoyl-tripeptide--D-alanyl-D-alanine ligase [Clostridia bacterium]|nr:UDP-N-acetylmuramoyl-tripeptide--D-alanyl-D-alanine ligase [Clostridia bacterium]
MEVLTAREIAMAVGGSVDGESQINAVCIDSRKVERGCLFVAIKGDNFDGHDFIELAVKNGAHAIMSHNDIECEVPVIKVDDTSKALLALGGYYRSRFDIPLVSLTGSVGKTTTKEMVFEVLCAKYKTLKTQGNLNNEIGLPMTLFGLDRSYEAAVIEMGMNHSGEISRLSKATRPTMGVITNIGVSHIENLGSRENILNAKLEMLGGLKWGSTLILNGDNDLLSQVQDDSYNIIFFGIENEQCAVRAFDIKQVDGCMQFTVLYKGETKQFVIPTLGIHNVYNALSAIAVGVQYEISLDDCTKALENYTPSGMRQRVKKVANITFVEDCYNSSPDSVKAAICTLRDMGKGRKIAVLGDMLELGSISAQAHYDSGVQVAQNKIDMLFTFGKKSNNSVKAAQKNGIAFAQGFDNKNELIKKLEDTLKDGDTVLFKASRGMELEEVIEALYINLKHKDADLKG